MLKFIILFCCLGVFILLVKNQFNRNKLQKVKDTVKDPVCGAFVMDDSPLKLKYKGRIFNFCSKECMDRFRDEKQTEAV